MFPTPPPITMASGSRMLMTAAIASPNLELSLRSVARAAASPSSARADSSGMRSLRPVRRR
jgi:hypothetical protein